MIKSNQTKSRIVITYGTFDLLHYGHIELLRRAKVLANGGDLIVGLSSDEFNLVKGKKSFQNFQTRKTMLSAIRYIDTVVRENDWEQKIKDIKKYKVDLFVMGDDWMGKFDYLSEYCQVVYLTRTPKISSTGIKTMITSNS